MKKLKVYLQYPLVRSDSQYYKSILDNSPKEVEYYESKKNAGMSVSARRIGLMRRLKIILRWIFNKTKLPLPSAFYVGGKEKYDLIHCAHCLCLNKHPWVADIEFYSQMWGGVKLTKARKFLVKKLLLRKSCKKIMPWTEITKQQILKEFPEVKNKIEKVSYAMPSPKFEKVISKKISLLFTARYFDGKGGFDAVEVINTLTKKYSNVYGTIISNIPKEILEKYSKNKKIKFYGLMPYEKIVKEIYPFSDIYIYPGYTDSFGFTFVEAQAFGLPVVTVEGFARDELIEDGKTGYIISRKGYKDYYHPNKKIIEELLKKTEYLIKNKNKRRSMSLRGIKEVREGKFSLNKRNSQLKKIYEESIK
jgi:glycosyltransferase involved in cell wall biosynthesis